MQAAIRVGVWIGLVAAAQMAVGQGQPACLDDLVAARCPQEAVAADLTRVCHWEFAYRAPKAGALYQELSQSVRACLGEMAERASDSPVNHPDSYDLTQFVSGNVSVAVSLKDKASQSKTFVFLRLEPVE